MHTLRCAPCSRHVVRLMLGSSTAPAALKNPEAESEERYTNRHHSSLAMDLQTLPWPFATSLTMQSWSRRSCPGHRKAPQTFQDPYRSMQHAFLKTTFIMSQDNKHIHSSLPGLNFILLFSIREHRRDQRFSSTPMLFPTEKLSIRLLTTRP